MNSPAFPHDPHEELNPNDPDTGLHFSAKTEEELHLFDRAGEGCPGLKVEDMESSVGQWGEYGIQTATGLVLLDSFYHDFYNANSFNLSYDQPLTAEEREGLRLPDSLEEENIKILQAYPETVLAIRPSGIAERGGIGIWETKFFVPSGNLEADLYTLGRAELDALASNFSARALAYHDKYEAGYQMGLLVQPVEGTWHNDLFYPYMAGSGYISHYGKPLLRVALGLGTRAVDDEAVVLDGEFDAEELPERLCQLRKIDAIDRYGSVVNVEIPQKFREALGNSDRAVAALKNLSVTIKSMQADGKPNLAFEWVIATPEDSTAKIVQSSPYQQNSMGTVDLECAAGELMASSSDTIGHGRKEVTMIIQVPVLSWSPEIKRTLQMLNHQHSNYLLIIGQDATSRFIPRSFRNQQWVGEHRIEYQDFCNAGAIWEGTLDMEDPGLRMYAKQCGYSLTGHGNEKAGQHFAELCDREDILYVGAPSRGHPYQHARSFPNGVRTFDFHAVIAIDQTSSPKQGRVYFLPEVSRTKSKYELYQVKQICGDLRTIANQGCNDDKSLTSAFYDVHYSLPDNERNFDPFEPEPIILEDIGGLEGLRVSLDLVLGEGREYLNSDMVEYLEDYRKALRSRPSKE